jgi:SAM-dependent methyltransferase
MTLKNVIKGILPDSVNSRIGTMLMLRRQRYLSQLGIQDAFDEIYKKKMWKQGDSLSGVGSEGTLARDYIQFVLDYAQKHNIQTVVDAGCGDFSVGSQLAPRFERYSAFDISPHVIEINKKRFADLMSNHHVTFAVADMTTTALPACDLVLIRQVLQHLTNTQIEQILINLESSKWRRVLISEEVYDPENNQQPNIDLPSHGVANRVALESGVFIDREPFNRPAKRLIAIRDLSGISETPHAGLQIFELTRDDEAVG